MYILPDPRPVIVIDNRENYTDPETGICVEPVRLVICLSDSEWVIGELQIYTLSTCNGEEISTWTCFQFL